MKKALITGVTGQDGSYLSDLLLEKKYEVYGLNRRKATPINSNITKALQSNSFHFIEGDLLEINRVNQIIKDIQPDEIYNMAAQSFVPYSWDNPIYTCDVNFLGLIRLLDTILLFDQYL